MKKFLVPSIAISLLLSSCVGNTSLWGQYLTPTPIGWVPAVSTPEIPAVITDASPMVSFPIPTDTPIPTVTPTALANFVTKEPAQEPTIVLSPVIADDAILYYAQSGDWLPAVAGRFGVEMNEITSPKILPESGFLDTGTLLIIPDRLDTSAQYTPASRIIPDSEMVYSGTATGFDAEQYVRDAGGYLSTYREYLGTTAWTSGGREINRLAYENSINPRLLLALLDYEAGWVRGRPADQFHIDYPMGEQTYRDRGMFGQMTWTVSQLNDGYYGWRTGQIKELVFSDGNRLRLDPTLNAGTVAVMNYFSKHHSLNEWLRIMDVNSGFPAFYRDMFGDPWSRADSLGNLFPPGLKQPSMNLPIEPRTTWAFTGGPHGAWGEGRPLAAIDFAPENDTPGCFDSLKWVLTIAPGLVVRSEHGVVIVDMDGDGSEQTGWNILYLHVDNNGRIAEGQWVEENGRIGHPSCEGGKATGTHVHIARKYNGEWMLADGPIPFVLDGWTVIAGDKPYLGKLVNGSDVITADVYAQAWSLITREDD